ncbi:MAG: hypothetical protein DWQ04_18270 [Chloroflexi bacterium]|nr:MAG: hypothetical protein DWQ04_18270 [Chloroflexota bacterium]
MHKMHQTQLQRLTTNLFLLSFLGIPWLVDKQFFQKWSRFVVDMPLIAGLILPVALFLCALLYQKWLKPDTQPQQNRILLLRNDSILSEGLIRLLQQQSNVIVSTISAVNMDVLQEEMDIFQPNTVILPDQDTIFAQLLDFLDDYPNLRSIIRVGTENDQIRVYEKNQVSIQHIDDFATVLNGQGVYTSLKPSAVLGASSRQEDAFWRE